MDRLAAAVLATALLLFAPLRVAAQAVSLTFEEAIALARERAPALLSARDRTEEARARLIGAKVLLRENPVIDGGLGRRSKDTGDVLDAQIGLTQSFELGGRRDARIAAAQAGIARASAGQDDALQRLLRDVAVSFHRVLQTEEGERLAENAEGVAAEVARIAERRYRADEVPYLDVNVSRAALARAHAERREAAALHAAAQGELRLLLGLEGTRPLSAHGELRARRDRDLAALLERARQRADLRALEAELADAEAEIRLAASERWPELGLGARYERDDEEDVVLGTLSFTLPIFERGQGPRAESLARARRLRREIEAARRAAEVEVRAAFEVYTQREAAALELETSAVPLLDENESLARRSYEAGQIGLAELLVLRRETLEARREYLDRALAAVVAAFDLEASAGGLQ